MTRFKGNATITDHRLSHHGRIQKGGGGRWSGPSRWPCPPWKSQVTICFLRNSGTDPSRSRWTRWVPIASRGVRRAHWEIRWWIRRKKRCQDPHPPWRNFLDPCIPTSPKGRESRKTTLRQQAYSYSKATSYLFLGEMIAKLERELRTTLQNKNPAALDLHCFLY